MLRIIWGQLRGRPRRTLALLAGMLVATTGFTVLSAGAAVQRLQVDGEVAANYRPAYDILVRPKGSRTDLEEQRGLVAPNYLSGLYGGITSKQVDQVRATGGVAVAAPIAMLGYTFVILEQTVDLTGQVNPALDRQVIRLTPSWIADRGLTVLDDAPLYVYLTRNQIVPSLPEPGTFKDGTRMAQLPGCSSVLEVEPDGRRQQICAWHFPTAADTGTTDVERTHLVARQLAPDGRFVAEPQFGPSVVSDRLTVRFTWRVAVLAAAVDPVAEADLIGLDKAVVSGRYLGAEELPEENVEPGMAEASFDVSYTAIPTIMANAPYVDEQVDVSAEQLGAAPAEAIPGRTWSEWVPQLATTGGTPPTPLARSSATPRLGESDVDTLANLVYQPGPVQYRTDSAGVLHPQVVPPDPGLWQVTGNVGGWADSPPRFAMEDGFRPVTQVGGTTIGRAPMLTPVGEFDPAELRGFSPLSRVPMETYQAPQAEGADQRSTALLDGKPLLPNSNPAGYLNAPPLILTNLASLPAITPMTRTPDPISAVRVRVAGVTGVDEHSQELVRSTAEKITAATGLDVDITIGSSPAPQTVELPAGSGGRPVLTLTEGWSRKGVAVAIVAAADRKSLVLFGLILVVCTLFLGNAVGAAVRGRRQELAVLTCLGWPARRLAGVVFAEVLAVGLVAGALGTGAALALARFAEVPLPVWHALSAIPVGLGVATLAAAPPALAAAVRSPAAALGPAVLGVRRTRRRHTVLGLALANLWRVPGRTALGVAALAVGIAALTMLVVIAVVFHNDVVGSLLGDAVAVRVRAVDVLATVTAVGLGVAMVADVLYINIRERAAELAALWATGWSNRALLRLVGYEGLGIGVLGGVLGAGAGLAGVTWFAGRLDPAMVWLAAGAAAGAVVVAGLAAVLPALALRRLPLSTLLAEE